MSSHGDVMRAFLMRRADAIEHALERFWVAHGFALSPEVLASMKGCFLCFTTDDTETYYFDDRAILSVVTTETQFTITELWPVEEAQVLEASGG